MILNSARKFIGEAAHCLSLSRELQARGFDTQLVVKGGCELESRLAKEGIPMQSLHFNGGFHPFLDLADFRRLRRQVLKFKPDVMHVNRGKDHWLAASVLLTITNSPVLVRTRHVVVPMREHVFNRWLFRHLTDSTIAVSQKAAESLGGLRSIREPNIIYSAVDSRKFSPNNRNPMWRQSVGVHDDEILVGLVARLQNIKGQHVFLEAAAIAREQDPRLKFLVTGAGAPHKRQKLCRLAKKLGIADHFILLDWIEEIEQAIASLDIGVVASLGSEGSSRVTYEYMASGVPVIATKVGVIPEIVQSQENGILVDPGDSGELAQAILALATDRELRQALARKGNETVFAKHTFDRWTGDIIEVYESAIRRRRDSQKS
jgi:glycosyltransferase involved in cell wall biosynthesis